MFTIFKKKKSYDLHWLGVDMHSHLLPGIDDGCPDNETAIVCIQGLQELGLHTFYATPHIFSEIYPNTPQSIQPAYEQLRQALDVAGMQEVKLSPAAEYMIDDRFTSYYDQGGQLMTLPGKKVLIEMSYQFERKDLNEQIFQLQLHNYQPILAHPERYLFFHSNLSAFKRLKEKGCQFQLNILSLSGYYGGGVRKVALQLLKENMIDYLGTDLHHEKHLKALRHFVEGNDLHRLIRDNYIQNDKML